LKLPLN